MALRPHDQFRALIGLCKVPKIDDDDDDDDDDGDGDDYDVFSLFQRI